MTRIGLFPVYSVGADAFISPAGKPDVLRLRPGEYVKLTSYCRVDQGIDLYGGKQSLCPPEKTMKKFRLPIAPAGNIWYLL